MDLHVKYPNVIVRPDDATCGEAHTIFIIGKIMDMERIEGLLFDSWSTCGNVSYGKEEKEYLDSRKGRK